MTDPHDKEIYKRPYNRPNERWVCGRAAEGKPCPHGPSRHGHCVVGYECEPASVDGRWVCTRPEQYGGPCDSPALSDPAFGPMVSDGVGVCCKPVHCTPRRSLRALRGRFSLLVCLVLVGIVLTGLGGGWRNTFISPGPLTVNHLGASMGSLEEMEHSKLGADGNSNVGGESCHICHTSLEGGLEGLLLSAVRKEAPMSQSAQCLACHQEDVGDMGLYSHALSPEALALHTAEASVEDFSATKPLSLALASLSPGVKMNDDGQLACAACHHEHNGALHDLKRIGNQKCQTCHVKVFKGIAKGHPEFSSVASRGTYDYPYRRRTRIIFDHERHETNYFQKAENLDKAPSDCTSCHEVEGAEFSTRLKPFEEMCASCHMSNIVSARDEWIHVFGYPSLEFDVYEILEDELELPYVPRTARKSMSPFMTLLLEGFNAQSEESQATFTKDLAMVSEFEGDLSGIVYDEDPAIVGRVFEGFQYLEGAAMNEDQGGLRNAVATQLERLSGAPIEQQQLDAMFGFPEMGDTAEKVLEDVSRKDIVENSGWHVEESGYRMDGPSWLANLESVDAYRELEKVAEELGAGPYKELLDLIRSYSKFREWFDDNVQIVGEDWVQRATGDTIKNSDWKDLIGAMVGGVTPTPEDAETDSEAPADSTEEESAEAEEDGSSATSVETPIGDVREAGEALVAWFGKLTKFKRWLEETADTSDEYWLLRAPRSLYYRPIKHGDAFTTAWLDFTASLYAKSPAAAMVFDELSGRASGSGIGACMKCHSIDAETSPSGGPSIKVNWKSTKPQRDFNRFDHTPHLKLMNCAECHRAPWVSAVRDQMDVAKAGSAEEETTVPEATLSEVAADNSAAEGGANETPEGMDYLDSFKAGGEGLEIGVEFANHSSIPSAHSFVSNFEPIAKDDCTRCHVASKAGDSCLICHNYHVKPRSRSMGVASLRDLIAEKKEPKAAP